MLNLSDLDSDQRAAIAFIDGGEDTLLAADVGTGKTVIAYTAAKNALDRGEVLRWLVLAPVLVATDTWAIEPALWKHLQNLNVKIACGDASERRHAIESGAEIVVMNYDNLGWLLDEYPRKGRHDTLPFDGLICDEIDKLKDVSGRRYKAFRNRIKIFRKRIGMTGTLIPNDLTELWGQTYMVDEGESFSQLKMYDGKNVGRSFYNWRKHFFYPIDFNQRKWRPFEHSEAKILAAIDGLVFRLEATGLPEVVFAEPSKLTLPDSVRRTYSELEKEFLVTVQDDDGNNRIVDANNSGILQGKLQQLCAGFSYVDKTKEVVWHDKSRFEWLDDLLTTKLPRKQVLIVYHFNAELDELRRRFPGLRYLGQGVSNKAKRAHIKAWNAGELPMLAVHPSSAGHGLNLQKSGAHHIAFLTLPWSGGMFTQVTGRLARRGQSAKHIFVHCALNENTVDGLVHSTLKDRVSYSRAFLNRLRDKQNAA